MCGNPGTSQPLALKCETEDKAIQSELGETLDQAAFRSRMRTEAVMPEIRSWEHRLQSVRMMAGSMQEHHRS